MFTTALFIYLLATTSLQFSYPLLVAVMFADFFASGVISNIVVDNNKSLSSDSP